MSKSCRSEPVGLTNLCQPARRRPGLEGISPRGQRTTGLSCHVGPNHAAHGVEKAMALLQIHEQLSKSLVCNLSSSPEAQRGQQGENNLFAATIDLSVCR